MDAVRYIDEHFEKLKLLHEGKVTVIWLVLDRQDQNACALKIIRRTGLPYAQLAKLSCEGIPRIRLAAEAGNETYVVEEYLHGVNLVQYAKEHGPMPELMVKLMARELCRTLSVLHAAQIIHRDIKPSNIFRTAEGHYKLLDFDSARLKKENQSADTVCLGTQGFAAPEQYGAQQTDERSDIYALGVTMRVLLGEGYTGWLQTVIEKCTEFDVKRRYQSASALDRALQRGSVAPGRTRGYQLACYHLYHLLPFVFGLSLFWLLLDFSDLTDWHALDGILWRMGGSAGLLAGRVYWQRRSVSEDRIQAWLDTPPQRLRWWEKALWGGGYCLAWAAGLISLVAGIGISYSRPWERLICSSTFILPIFFAVACVHWRQVPKDQR